MDTKKNSKNEHIESTKDSPKKGDPETLNTTDPQEHMEGPLSSLMHSLEHSFKNKQTEEEVKKKEENK